MALTKPFAEQGEKKAISLTPDAEGTMNYQDGFGQRYSLPVKSTISEDGTITTTGGLWIQREQFNQLMFDTTSAIIENQDNITQLNQDLGNKDDLTTTNKDNIVSAINELDSNIGDLQDLTTTEKSNVVSAINEIDSNYVRLDTEQTIPSVKTFSNVVNFGSIVNVNGEANFNDNVEMVNTPTITSPKTFQDLIDNELITKAQSVSKFVDFDTNQSVSGLKTFTTLPQSEATPTDDKDLTTKLYVDTTLSDKIAEIGKAMGFKGIVENATDLPTDTATDGDMYYNKATSGETEDNKKGFYVFNGTAFDFIGATISMDFDKIFEIEEKQGDLTQLKTTAKDSLVNAINENHDNIATNSNNIGTLGNLTTTAKDNLVNAINENKASIDTNKSQVDSSLGDLTQLKTTAKDSLVNAINENYDSIETNSQHIADNEGAISTINDNIGDLNDLTTTAKTSVVNAINEIDNSLKNNNFVTLDTEQTITSLKTFDKLPQSSVTPANDTDLVTKSYVDTQIADIDTTNPANNLAKLDSNNQFTGENTFDIIPKSNGTPANDTDLVTKAYVDNIQVDTTNLAKLAEANTFTALNTFDIIPKSNGTPANDTDLVTKAYVDSVGNAKVDLSGNQTISGNKTFSGQVNIATLNSTSNPNVTNPKEWATLTDNEVATKKQIVNNIGTLGNLTTTAKDNLVNSINEVNATTPKLLNTNLTWTVGTGGNYTKLADALMEACKYQNIPNIGITITLKTGYDLASESINVNNVDLRFVTINCQSKLVCQNTRHWLNIVNSIAPTINLNVDASLNSGYILGFNCSNGLITMNGDYNYGVLAIRNSNIQINGGTINCVNGDGIAIYSGQAANISINAKVIIKGTKNTGMVIEAYNGSKIIKNGGGNVNIQLSGTAQFLAATATSFFYGFNGTINSTSTKPVYYVSGGSYGYNYSTITGTAPQANIPFNTITSNGIIFD